MEHGLKSPTHNNPNWILFKSFLLAGTFTFAGGIAMLPALKIELVDKHHLLDTAVFYEYAAMAQAVPGIIGLNFALLIGQKTSKQKGMLVSAFGTIFPAFTLMLSATILEQFIPQDGPIQFALVGVRAASTSAVFMAAYALGKHLIKNRLHWTIVGVSFGVVGLLSISSIYVIIGAAFLGIVLYLGGYDL